MVQEGDEGVLIKDAFRDMVLREVLGIGNFSEVSKRGPAFPKEMDAIFTKKSCERTVLEATVLIVDRTRCWRVMNEAIAVIPRDRPPMVDGMTVQLREAFSSRQSDCL